MTTVIRGTDDSASTPALTGTDADTGVFFPAANTMAMSTDGSERMRIDSSGNVGIGTTSPTGITNYRSIALDGTTGSILDLRGGGTLGARIVGTAGAMALETGGATFMNFFTNGTERMRIDSSGNLLVGTTSNTGSGASSGKQVIQFNGAVGNGIYLDDTRTASGTDVALVFGRGATAVGQISTTTTSTSYVTSSDYRLKENVAPMTGALAKVLELNPVTYTWKADGSAGEGFIAHELQEVAPYAVSGEKDGERMQGVDYGKITPLLTAALQEAIAKIETLEARIAVLEAK